MAFSRSRKLGNLGKSIDSSALSDFLTVDDSGGKFRDVQYSEITGKPTLLDSSTLSSLVDSSYIQLRQTDVGIDSGQITNLVDSSYVQARQGAGGLDSAKTTNLIDSAYVAARITAGLDSSSTINLVDSDYIGARTSANSGFTYYKYTSTAGQTAYTGSDDNGETLSYSTSTDNILVFYNGILLIPTDDYTTSGGDTVTLTAAADSGSPVTIGRWAVASASGGSPTSFFGTRGVIYGGYGTAPDNFAAEEMQYITIATPGNAQDFGDLITARYNTAAHSDGSRGIVGGGSPTMNSIEYVTIGTTGNAQDFGDLTEDRYALAGAGDLTRTLFAGGHSSQNVGAPNSSRYESQTIDYVTTGTTGDATDFGDLTNFRDFLSATSDLTYTLITGGEDTPPGSKVNTIDYVTTQTTGNASDFGDLTLARSGIAHGVVANSTRGVLIGGYTGAVFTDVMDYVTIATPGNAVDFGDMHRALLDAAGTSDGTYGIYAGGYGTSASPTIDETIRYFTIATTGNTSDFGDLMAIGGSTAHNARFAAASGT